MQRMSGVTVEDRRALLGHKNGSIISHYSDAGLGKPLDGPTRYRRRTRGADADDSGEEGRMSPAEVPETKKASSSLSWPKSWSYLVGTE